MKTQLKPEAFGAAELAGQATALAASLTDSMRSLSGLSVPPHVAAEAAERLPRRVDRALEPDARGVEAGGAGQAGSPLRRAGVDDEPVDRLHRADVPAERPHAAADGRRARRRREDQGAHPLRGPAVGRRVVAEQLPRAQPRSAAQGARDRRREHQPRPEAPARRHPPGPHVADRRERVRGRPQCRDDRRRGRLRERAVPADRIQAADREGLRAAVPARAALHQQVLHPRPAARQLADPLRRPAGPSGVRAELAQRRRSRRAADLGPVHRGRGDQGDRPGAGDQRQREDQRARLLRRRHDPRDGARRARGARREAGREHDPADHACSTSATPACSTSSSTRRWSRCAS